MLLVDMIDLDCIENIKLNVLMFVVLIFEENFLNGCLFTRYSGMNICRYISCELCVRSYNLRGKVGVVKRGKILHVGTESECILQ
jgi:hypothetical protein